MPWYAASSPFYSPRIQEPLNQSPLSGISLDASCSEVYTVCEQEVLSMRMPKEMSKGSHELILLKLLSRKDMYGYQLIQEMALLSEDVFHMSQGSLYPFLHALEDRGLISSYTQAANGRERRFYHLTASGHRALAEQEDQWAVYTRAMGRILKEAER